MSTEQRAGRLVDLRDAVPHPLWRPAMRLLAPLLDRLLALAPLNRVYNEVQAQMTGDECFFDTALRVLGVTWEAADADLERIPRNGPAIIVANHPFGGLDGVVLGSLLNSVRSDSRLLVNELLTRIVEMRPWLFAVNAFGGRGAARDNVGAMRSAVRWVRGGGLLGVFPSGTVSHLHLRRCAVSDPVWQESIARLIRLSHATVIPVHFTGRNSMLFQLAGLLHPRLRTLLLPRELMKRKQSHIHVRIGRPIPFEQLARFEADRDLADFLRLRTYVLDNRNEVETPPKRRFPLPRRTSRKDTLAPPVEPALMAAEVQALRPDQCLTEHGDMAVYLAEAEQIPETLREIGRLREKTFREVGEGTGHACDLDRFDAHYLHLFLWSKGRHEVGGAYRLGPTDLIQGRGGSGALYTRTLFRFRPGFLEHISPALELGRSFIRSEYQKKHTSLSLLWRGIGEFVARNPRYRILFGPVSISADYSAMSRNLMVQFLQCRAHGDPRRHLVRGKHPPRTGRFSRFDRTTVARTLRDIDDVSAVISEIEADSKGVPVLIRHYLKVNGRILTFNVDRRFSRVIDGLIVVDLTRTEPRLLARFLGAEGSKRFLSLNAPDPIIGNLPPSVPPLGTHTASLQAVAESAQTHPSSR